MVEMMSKPRILFIGTLPPPVHGSAVVSQQIKDSKVINEAFDDDWINLGTSRSMDEIGKRNLAKVWRLVAALGREFWLLLTRRYDLCYLAITCHGSGFLKDSPFILMAKLFGKKIVIHQHNKGMANDVDRWPYRWLLPLCYKNAKVILLSWYLYPDIERVVPRENVYICPNGIKVQEFKSSRVQESPETWNMKPETNRVSRLLFLSNLIESKGVLVLLDALKILKDKGYSFVCDFVGGETKEIDAKRFNVEVETRGLNEIALYQGRMYGEEKEDAFEQSDVFVLPTMNDCFPLVILEAMEYGKPIVTTAIGGIPDIVDDDVTGLIAKAGDAESLADSLGRVLKDKDLAALFGENGKKKLLDKYTEKAFETTLSGVLTQALGGAILVESLEFRVQSCCVRYLGRKYGEEKERVFRDSDIFVFPTYYDNECFPLVLLEAMQHGLPCVTTDEGGIGDIVAVNSEEIKVKSYVQGECGFVCKKRDAEAVAEALTALITNPQLRSEMGERGRQLLNEKFTEAVFERRMSEILNGIAS